MQAPRVAIASLEPGDVVRGQFRGYRREKAEQSTVETFVVLRLRILQAHGPRALDREMAKPADA